MFGFAFIFIPQGHNHQRPFPLSVLMFLIQVFLPPLTYLFMWFLLLTVSSIRPFYPSSCPPSSPIVGGTTLSFLPLLDHHHINLDLKNVSFSPRRRSRSGQRFQPDKKFCPHPLHLSHLICSCLYLLFFSLFFVALLLQIHKSNCVLVLLLFVHSSHLSSLSLSLSL